MRQELSAAKVPKLIGKRNLCRDTRKKYNRVLKFVEIEQSNPSACSVQLWLTENTNTTFFTVNFSSLNYVAIAWLTHRAYKAETMPFRSKSGFQYKFYINQIKNKFDFKEKIRPKRCHFSHVIAEYDKKN